MPVSFAKKVTSIHSGMLPLYMSAFRRQRANPELSIEQALDHMVSLNESLFNDALNLLENHYDSHCIDKANFVEINSSVASFIQSESLQTSDDDKVISERFYRWFEHIVGISTHLDSLSGSNNTQPEGKVPLGIVSASIKLCCAIERSFGHTPLRKMDDVVVVDAAIDIIQNIGHHTEQILIEIADSFSTEEYYCVASEILDATAHNFDAYYRAFSRELINKECEKLSLVIKNWKALMNHIQSQASSTFPTDILSNLLKPQAEKLSLEYATNLCGKNSSPWKSAIQIAFLMRIMVTLSAVWSDFSPKNGYCARDLGQSPVDDDSEWDDDQLEHIVEILISYVKIEFDDNQLDSFMPTFNELSNTFMNVAKNVAHILKGVFKKESQAKDSSSVTTHRLPFADDNEPDSSLELQAPQQDDFFSTPAEFQQDDPISESELSEANQNILDMYDSLDNDSFK